MANQATLCIFCGADTEEQRMSSMGEVFIHSDCLIDLEEILSFPAKELEGVKS